MAIRGGKKLPDKRGFVDGPGGYKGKDDRDRGFGGSSSGSGSSSGGSSSGGSGSGNFNNTPALKTNYTMADVKKNKIAKQLQKAESAASQHKGITGTAYLDQYNTLKAKKDKTKNQLSNLAAMNEQMGYNPTQGMGIMGSLNYNTIGAGDDIANLMNNPLVKMAGMATNPAMFAGGQFLKNAYGAYTDENDDTGLLSALGNTAQDVTPFDTSKVKDFLGNIFRQEEEEADYVGSEVINTAPIEPVETGPLDGKTSSNTYQPIQGMVLDKILGFIEPVTDFYNQATTPLTDIELNSNPLLNSKITPDNIDQYQNNSPYPSLCLQTTIFQWLQLSNHNFLAKFDYAWH